ncbi:MAG: thiamine pyrophosphate-binding protein [Rhodospirillaceae bacterium]|nr:thiamine pyrophosphate-binding protein [Rhodospirillaceae bacterium]
MSDTVAELVVETLIRNGIENLYCLPGVQNDDFFDALYDKQNRLKPVTARHEQGAAYMALGAALATGRPQAFAVVPGPGFLNASAALATAYATNAPVLALVGQIPSRAVGKGFGLLHELPDQLGVLDRLTKQAATITGGGEAHALLQSAFAALQSGRRRPVGVEVPVNVWKAPVEGAPADLSAPAATAPEIDTGRVDAAVRLLEQAERPLIVVGGGAQDCSAEVTRLAEMLSAPAVAYRTGRGVVSSEHDLSAGAPVGHALWPDCDVVLGIGTRLNQQMLWGTDDALKIVHIDIDAEELGRVREPDVALHADAREAVPMLIAALEGKEAKRGAWRDRVSAEKARFAKAYRDRLGPQMAWLDAIRAELPRDGIFVDELTQVGYVARLAFPSYMPRTHLTSAYQGTLGWGIPSGLGAAHARPDVPVVAIAGDGGALFGIGELATAVHYGIPLTAVVFNDNAYGNVKRFQIENYDNRPIASDLTSPDFVRLAESFGARGLRAETPEDLRQRLREAFKGGGPTVIEVPVGDFPSPWDFLMLPKVRRV